MLRSIVIFALILIAFGEGFLYVTNRAMFTFALPVVAIIIISSIYFMNNPVGHKTKFRIRSFLNWMPKAGLSSWRIWA